MAVYVEHNQITVPLWYERRAARGGSADLYSSDGISWSTMEDSGADIDANWNISIGLSPYSPASSMRGFEGIRSSGIERCRGLHQSDS